MRYMRSLICFLCLFLMLGGAALYAAETEPDPSIPSSDASADSSPGGGEAESGEMSAQEDAPQADAGQADPAQGISAQGAPAQSAAADAASIQTGQEDADPETEPVSESESERGEIRDPMFALALGEEVTISVRIDHSEDGFLSAAANDTTTVKVKVLDVYDYDKAGLGDGTGMFTNKYQVTFNDIKAVAYCLDPAKDNPKMSDNFSISKYDDGKSVARILYYAQADAENGGYFALKHPGYSDAKQFIITHMAAAKASGSSSWDAHANSDAKKEANALIEYAESMPSIPDPEISFTPASVTSVLQGNAIRTGTVTLVGSEGNSANVTLPSRVTLNNLTSASRSGTGTVTLEAGDRFTLTYPLPARTNLTATIQAVGQQTRDYSAYKIKTDSDTQNLGLIFGEGLQGENTASVSVRFSPQVSVRAGKKDADTQHALQGATFGLYAAEDMTEADGTKRKKDQRIAGAVSGADGRAVFSQNLTIGLNYYVIEEKAPQGYLCNTQLKMPVSVGMQSGSAQAQTIEQTFPNEPVTGRIMLYKVDRELQEGKEDGAPAGDAGNTAGNETEAEGSDAPSAQGDAVLEGAEYGLYARKDILRSDQSGTVLYKAGDLVSSKKTDMLGQILWDDLPLGSYYIREIAPSEGYVLDETEYPAELAWKDSGTPVIETSVTVTEQVAKQAFSLMKRSLKNDADPLPLAGAGFSAWLVSSLKKNQDTYDTTGVDPVVLCADGSTEMFTDESGMAVSVPLPYGTYLVRETTVPPDHLAADEFIVRIDENSPDTPQTPVTRDDQKVQGQIRLVKTGPMLTGYRKGKFIYEVKGLAGAVFEVTAAEDIFRTDADGYENGKEVLLYKAGEKVTQMTTDSSGQALSKELPLGRYTVKEVTAPYGTVLQTQTYGVELKADGSTPVVVRDLAIEDPRQKVEIQVVKVSSKNQKTTLKGAEFTLFARENIYARSTDGSSQGQLLVRAGEALCKAKSGKGGKAVFDLDLPNASYYVQETKAPAGYEINTRQYNCDCTYKDSARPVISIRLKIPDDPVPGENNRAGNAPKTGDNTPVGRMVLLLLLALASIELCFAGIWKRRKPRIR